MNGREQRKLAVIGKVDKGEIGGGEAAALLGISLRQLRRVMTGWREGGVGALAHGNRGRMPPNAVEEAVRRQVLELASSSYAGCNTQHFTELLAEREGIELSRSTVRRFLIGGGVSRPRVAALASVCGTTT